MMWKKEQAMRERYEKAVQEDDNDTLAWFSQFGSPKWEHQMICNAASYEQYLACGYTEKPMMNEYGWLLNGSCKELVEKAELLQLFKDGNLKAEAWVLQHPNGMWIATLDYSLPICGGGSWPCVWDKQYPSRRDALNAVLDKLINVIEKNEKERGKRFLPIIKRMRGDRIQLTLF